MKAQAGIITIGLLQKILTHLTIKAFSIFNLQQIKKTLTLQKLITMTPKEKAIELIDKMLHCYQGHIDEYTAKQCALIAVDEIIKDNPNIYDSDRLNYKYWNEVKKEIEKL
jgi:hypothetical protein